MHLSQINKFYDPVVGGIEKVVKDVAEGAERRGHRSEVVCSRPRGVGRAETRNGVTVRRATSAGTILSTPISPTFPYHLAQAYERADVVHHHVPNPIGVVSDLLVGDDQAATVVTYHSDIVRQSRSLRVYRPLLRGFLNHADRIVVTSPRLLEHSRELQGFEDKCEVVPLSVDLDSFPSRETVFDYEAGDRPRVLFVGRLNYYKGVEHLIDAVSNLTVELRLVGDGSRREALEERAAERANEAHVSFAGEVSDDELARHYREADVFVLPSVERSEAFGIVQLEAMAHGVPVVNTDLPTGVPWVSRDGETGLTVPPEDRDALRDAIETLASSADLRERLGRRARERVEEEFTREEMLTSLLDVYSAVSDCSV